MVRINGHEMTYIRVSRIGRNDVNAQRVAHEIPEKRRLDEEGEGKERMRMRRICVETDVIQTSGLTLQKS